MFGFGIGEWLLVAVIGLLLFGPRLFVRAATSLGQGVNELKRAVSEGEKAGEDADGRQASEDAPGRRVE